VEGRGRLLAATAVVVAAVIVATMAGCSSDDVGLLPPAGAAAAGTTLARGTDPPSTPVGTLAPALPAVTFTPDTVGGDQHPTATQAPPVATVAPDQPAQSLVFDPYVVVDPMAGGVPALAVLVPQGWQANAGVQWLPEWIRAAFLQTQVFDPATGIQIDWLPIQDFMYFPPPGGFQVPVGGNYQGKAYVPPITDPAQFVSQMWAPSTLPELQSATLVDVQEVPQIAQEFLSGFGGPGEAHAYRMRYQYQQGGQAWEEDLHFALLFSGDQNLTSWYVNFAYTVRAPAGLIDANAGVISTIVASRTTTPQWEATYRMVQRLFTQGIQQQMADTVAFGKALEAYRNEINALQQQVTAERQASEDRMAELRGQTLEGVQSYSDPVNGGLVQLPVGWDEYWVNEQGEYLASDVPGFDPNTMNDGVWQQLEVADI
jgi:hypothetical protein